MAGIDFFRYFEVQGLAQFIKWQPKLLFKKDRLACFHGKRWVEYSAKNSDLHVISDQCAPERHHRNFDNLKNRRVRKFWMDKTIKILLESIVTGLSDLIN